MEKKDRSERKFTLALGGIGIDPHGKDLPLPMPPDDLHSISLDPQSVCGSDNRYRAISVAAPESSAESGSEIHSDNN